MARSGRESSAGQKPEVVHSRHPGESRDLGMRSRGGSPRGPGFRRDDDSIGLGGRGHASAAPLHALPMARRLRKRRSMAKDDLVERVRQRTPACAKVGLFDVDGIFRGKYMAPNKLASALAGGF